MPFASPAVDDDDNHAACIADSNLAIAIDVPGETLEDITQYLRKFFPAVGLLIGRLRFWQDMQRGVDIAIQIIKQLSTTDGRRHSCQADHIGQLATVAEDMVTDAGNAAADHNAGEPATTLKGIIIDTGYRCWNRDTGERRTNVKCVNANTGDGIAQDDTRETGALVEGVVVDGGHPIGDSDAGKL